MENLYLPNKPRSDKLDCAVEHLAEVLGFDRSESASEAFYYLLQEAVDNLDGTIEASHKDGLCYDVTHALAGELRQLLIQRSGGYN